MTTAPGPGSAGYDLAAVGPVPLWKLSITASAQLVTGIGRMLGVSIVNEATTVAAKAYIRDGVDATGPVIDVIACPAGSSADHSRQYPGVLVRQGIYVQVVAGTLSVSVSWLPQITPPE